LNHTCVCLGYRFEADGRTVVYATDTEPHGLLVATSDEHNERKSGDQPYLVHREDRRLAEWAQHADLLIMDAQYTDEEYPKRIGWGHCTTSYTTDIAVLAGVKQLALYHHDPTRRDEMVDDIVGVAADRAQGYGSGVEIFGAAEGSTIEL
jgi:ribonuclease BN (tRNA processing enzyme)